MTKSARKSLIKSIATVIAIALSAVVIALQMIAVPISKAPSSFAPSLGSSDSMNGVKVTYREADRNLDEGFALSDGNVESTAKDQKTPAADEEVNVIITLPGDPMMSFAGRNGLSVAQASATPEGIKNLRNLSAAHDKAVSALSGYIKEYRYRYTAVANAFSATVRYGDIAAIEANKNVENVIVSETYLAPQAVTENYVDVYSTGIFDSSGIGFDGTGTVVAVLDTGTDYTHEVFDMELNADTVAITKDAVAAAVPLLAATSLSADEGYEIDEDDLFIKNKLPFAYDYADSDTNVYPKEAHGTHVAGIIAGKSETITGVAPGAQIATFKVFSDYKNGAETEWILAALNDAVVLGVDAINMSLGTSCGFSREVDEKNINEIYDAINDAGICLVVAASNDASSAQASTWGNTNLASNPDSGTVGSPASYDAALAVASVSGVKTKYFKVNGREVYFAESRLVGAKDANDFVKELLGDNAEGEYEYVVIPGVGESIDYSGLDLDGKIAVIKRGVTNFEDKVRVARDHGAIAAVVYNNVSGTISMSVGAKYMLPSCFVTQEYAADMVAAGSGVMHFSTDYLAGPFMSDFSSWGTLPNLELSPDITAHGGEIISAVPGGNKYDKNSGTSMACPNLAGALILVRQQVKETHPEYSTIEVRDESYSRMMSTATIVRNEEGNPYSPRKQGAGLADIASSVGTKAFLTVDGSNKPKLSLGDDPQRTGVYTMSFNIVNTSGNSVGYDLAPIVMTESMSIDGRTVAEKAHVFDDTVNTYKIEATKGKTQIKGRSISLGGYAEAKVTVTIALSAADKNYLNENFVNGMFVEGYIVLESCNLDGIDLGIPFLKFYGDWRDAPMLDKTAYEVGESEADVTIPTDEKVVADVYGTLPYSGFASSTSETGVGYYGMGQFAYIPASGYEQTPPQEKYAALTTNPEGDYLFYAISAGLLRGAKRVDMEIRNSATGELIWSGTDYNARKTHASGKQTGGLVSVELDIRDLDLPNNSRYTYTMVCYLDWQDGNGEYTYGNRNTFSFEFTVDNEKPELSDAAIRKVTRGGITHYILDLTLYDNHYIQGYSLSTYKTINEDDTVEGYRSISDGVIPVDANYNSDTTFSYDISYYWDTIMANEGKLVVNVFDYAKNQSTLYVDIKQETDLQIEPTRTASKSYTLAPNAQLDLLEYITISTNTQDGVAEEDKIYLDNDYWNKDLTWESSDDTVVAVDSKGLITGLKEGTATITVRTPLAEVFDEKDTKHCLKFEITVAGTPKPEIAMTGFEMSAETLELERGETATITATVKPYNYVGTPDFTWSSTRSNVKILETTVSEDGKTATATVKALDSGNATINIKLNGTYISGSCSIHVAQEFRMEENIYLRSYTGRGDEDGVVDIPGDMGIVYIYPRAFLNNEYVKKIIIPEGVTTIMEASFFGCTALEEVVLPKSCTTIEKLAFTNCSNLKKINLENVQTIGDSAFWLNALEEIDLSSCTYIDSFAFHMNLELKSVDLSNVGMVGGGAFAYCNSLTDLIIPETVSMAYDPSYWDLREQQNGGAFSNCTGLRTVTSYSKSIGQYAFFGCTGLRTVTFMKDVEVIGEAAFAGCTSLTNVDFYGTCYKIDPQAFASCSALSSFKLPDGLTVVGEGVFYGDSSITSMTVSSGANLSSVDAGAFYGMSIRRFVVEDGNKYLSTDENGVLYDLAKKKLIAYPFFRTATDFTVPDTVVTIGKAAFSYSGVYSNEGLGKLTNVDLNNVEYIEREAFYGSTVANITGAEKVTYIGASAFEGTLLTSLPFPQLKEIGERAFADCFYLNSAAAALVTPASLKKVGAEAFAGSNVTSVTVASELESVGDRVFAGCEDLTAINFGSLTSVSNGMFEGCTELISVVIPDTVTYIGSDAFKDCTSLNDVTLSANVTAINGGAFQNTAISSVDISDTVTYIGSNAFAGTKLTEVSLANVTRIGDGAFAGTKLTSVSSATVKYIGASAFAGCESLLSVEFGAAEYVGSNAFDGDVLLDTVSLGKVKEIASKAFAGCTALESVTFGSAEIIGDEAFSGASALTTVSLPKVERIGERVLEGTAVTAIALPATLEKVTEGAFYGAEKLAAITVDEKNRLFLADDGVLYSVNDGDYYTLICYPAAKKLEGDVPHYSVLARTIKLGAYSFSANKNLRRVTLPAYLQVIGISAMHGMDNLAILHINAPEAPTLESKAFLEIKYVYNKDTQKEEEVKNYYNVYDNFPFALDNNQDKGFTVTIPSNATGYDNRIWKQYVGRYIVNTHEIHAINSTLQFIDRVKALPAAPTADDAQEINALLRLYRIMSEAQKRIVLGTYEGYTDGENTIPAAVYQEIFGGVDFYAMLTAARDKLPSASTSAFASAFEGEQVQGMTSDTDVLPIVVATLAALTAAAVVASLILKRREER